MTLEQRQKAGQEVESQMIGFLLQFDPAADLSISDVKCIARYARQIAFEMFSADGDAG